MPLFFQTLLEAKEEENVESFTEAVSTLSLKGKMVAVKLCVILISNREHKII